MITPLSIGEAIMFGRAVENDGIMPRLAVYTLALIGLAGVPGSLLLAG
jgi:hypothetical protein